MENRILIIGDELLGEQGEVATRCVELLLCREPNRPMQFSVNAPALPTITQFIARASSDIIGKQAGRIVLGLGYNELKRECGGAQEVVKNYGKLLDEILKKTNSFVHLLTLPQDVLPEIRGQVNIFNEAVRGFVKKNSSRVFLVDFEKHAVEFKEKQVERGKFARQLYSEDAKPTSLCLTLLALFLQDCLLDTIK